MDKKAVAAIEEANPVWAKDADTLIQQMKTLKAALNKKTPNFVEYLAAKANIPTAKSVSDIFNNIKP